jgi:pimeloyl-ACP methyl ester carboxylesterase
MVGDVVQDAIAASFGGTQRELPLEYKKRSAEYWPEVLTMPIAITAGGQDTLVPPQSVLRLANVLHSLRAEPHTSYWVIMCPS